MRSPVLALVLVLPASGCCFTCTCTSGPSAFRAYDASSGLWFPEVGADERITLKVDFTGYDEARDREVWGSGVFDLESPEADGWWVLRSDDDGRVHVTVNNADGEPTGSCGFVAHVEFGLGLPVGVADELGDEFQTITHDISAEVGGGGDGEYTLWRDWLVNTYFLAWMN